ncbi:2-iminoacetate synthase ThiH [Buchnera aphidicola (Neophyllaphis varicolor)]|uniref:2-iminoacetate synthase ThiH n=1 Tax=Buchnera aphidicola TaxID=9 RepID=UPI0031B895E2
MKYFTDIWKNINWEDIALRINNKTYKDVELALNSYKLDNEGIMSLLSPSAANYIEHISQKSKYLTRQRFGNTISFFIPLYLSNLCSNECTYCGFSINNKIKRKILNASEIIDECKVIKKLGLDRILLVTGEHNNKVGMKYFLKHINILRDKFSSVFMEVQPLMQDEYTLLKRYGIDGFYLYQETYSKKCYDYHHLKGNKADFFFRLKTPDIIGKSGINKIGLGILLGLSDNWRVDCYFMALHFLWLRKIYWKTSFSISFPRLRSCMGGIKNKNIISDLHFLQIICTFRLLAPELELSLSTRESEYLRDNIVPIAINSMSVFSKTSPGGYNNSSSFSELEQFSLRDKRTPKEVSDAMIRLGLQPIFKDWDYYLGRR